MSDFEKVTTGLGEECGVFGAYDTDGGDVAPSIYYGLFALQHRGQESCGIAVTDTFGQRKVISEKGLGHVDDVFNRETLSKLKGNLGVGHVRYSTAGGTRVENAQPLVQETSENPLTESVSLPEGTCISGDGTVPQGIYDLTVDTSYEGGYGYSSITLLYPNGQSEYFWADGPNSAVTSSQYTDISVKNIVIPEGTEISVEYGGVILTPAEGYYDVDYSGYEGG